MTILSINEIHFALGVNLIVNYFLHCRYAYMYIVYPVCASQQHAFLYVYGTDLFVYGFVCFINIKHFVAVIRGAFF